MNYTLVAYIICTAIIITILAQPQVMVTNLREESYEKHQTLDYWLVVNALSYAYIFNYNFADINIAVLKRIS